MKIIDVNRTAKRLLLTDDPMRVKMLAAHYLEDTRLVSEARGLCAYSGRYRDVEIACVSCGYGAAAAEIILHELAQAGAQDVLYLGECVSLTSALKLRQLILACGGDEGFLRLAQSLTSSSADPASIHTVLTDDRYFLKANNRFVQEMNNLSNHEPGSCNTHVKNNGVSSESTSAKPVHVSSAPSTSVSLVDFATEGIYRYSNANGIAALSILTVTENIETGESVEESERQSRLHPAASLALETLSALPQEKTA